MNIYIVILLLLASVFCSCVLYVANKKYYHEKTTLDEKTVWGIVLALYIVITPFLVIGSILIALDYFELLFWKNY